jgi:PGM1 C-terminal domain
MITPTVRCLTLGTAHPSDEAWHRPNRGQPFVSPTPVERSPRFEELQRRLPTAEAATRAGRRHSVVVVPSRSIDDWHEPPAVTQAFEERLLCSLLELRDPNLRMTYVTSSPIAPSIIDYYLSLLPRRIRRRARSRLSLVAVGEPTARPLSEKLLARPRVLERIRGLIDDPAACYLSPYTTTPLERDVAIELGVPVYGTDPRLLCLGTKSGARAVFAQGNVPHPLGVEGITSVAAAVEGIRRLRVANSRITRVVIKLNDGVSGDGNAIADLAGLPEPGRADEAERITERLAVLKPEATGVGADAFLSRLALVGGVIEEWITAKELRSPSVQLRVTPFGEVELLSTHDQILGGPTGQSYLGCRFPAMPAYAQSISAHAREIGRELAQRGVIGRFAIDFVVTRDDDADQWHSFAIEINLRKGGTTHPYETLVNLTGGAYDPIKATFTTRTGQPKHYVATDHLESMQLEQLGRAGVLGLVRNGELRFDRMRRTGVVFHMLSSLDQLGRVGYTAIADSAEEADALSSHVEETLAREAEAATIRPPRRLQALAPRVAPAAALSR